MFGTERHRTTNFLRKVLKGGGRVKRSELQLIRYWNNGRLLSHWFYGISRANFFDSRGQPDASPNAFSLLYIPFAGFENAQYEMSIFMNVMDS
jgi:hypothetical protein